MIFPKCASLRIRREEDGSLTLIARGYLDARDYHYPREPVDVMVWSLT